MDIERSGSPRGGGRRKGSGRRGSATDPVELRRVQALADPVRWRIVGLLAGGGRSVGEIARAVDRSIACTSRHISILKEVELVEVTRLGRRSVCHLASRHSEAGRLLDAVLGSPSGQPAARSDSSSIPEFEQYANMNRGGRANTSTDIDDFLL